MDGVQLFPEHLQEFVDLMTEKELRLRLPLEELDILLEDWKHVYTHTLCDENSDAYTHSFSVKLLCFSDVFKDGREAILQTLYIALFSQKTTSSVF